MYKSSALPFHRRVLVAGVLTGLLAALAGNVHAQRSPEFPPHAEVLKGYDQVVSTIEGKSLYTIWTRENDAQIYAELPPNFASNKYFIALTIASGERFAGLQHADLYVYWKRYDDRLALIEPNTAMRASDPDAKRSVERLFTDRVILDVPIVTLGPKGGPIIDMDALLIGQASKFFGPRVRVANPRLTTIKKAKAFPLNVELAIEAPMSDGRFKTLHYSISKIGSSTGYRPRVADQRVGYFTTSYDDLGQFKEKTTKVRYINRWHLEKADPSLPLSPPKNPIEFYIENTTPVRYRRWVREGVLAWNKAFEKIGILDAIVVHDQDAGSNRNMDKDPEDVRYNFVRWLSNDVGTAIGPSRVNPMTGEILDADIIMTDGWIRSFIRDYRDELPKAAMEGFSAETLAWLEQHPSWDPRVRMAHPSERPHLLAERSRRGPQPHGGHAMSQVDPQFIGDDEYDGLVGRVSQVNGMCLAASSKSFDLALLRNSLDLLMAQDDDEEDEDDDEEDEDEEEKKKKKHKEKEEKKDEDKKKDEEKSDEEKEKEEEKPKTESKPADAAKSSEKKSLLDGIPEEFIGPLIADLVAHEVGHTLGLRHNFKASSLYRLKEINSEDGKQRPMAGSVMDYLPVNINMDDGAVQGDFGMVGIGPYDMWAIEYGYTFGDTKPILDRVAEAELQYATDEDTYGPDPLARRYDFSADPLEYADGQMKLARYHRGRLIEKFVQPGESWARAREGYEMTFYMQVRSLSMMANWLGGAHTHRDKKGDKNGRTPIEVVPVEKQRAAFKFVIENAFRDEAFGLTPAMLKHMATDQWLDGDYFVIADPTWPVHDRIMGIQSSVLTMLMNPGMLTGVYDNEFRLGADEDAVTLPEVLAGIGEEIWSELAEQPTTKYTDRKPWISSLRRNLQREHLERLIDLSLPGSAYDAAAKPIANLATMELRKLQKKLERSLEHRGTIDEYAVAHLSEAKLRIEKALEAQFIYNADDIGGGGYGGIIFLHEDGRESSSDR